MYEASGSGYENSRRMVTAGSEMTGMIDGIVFVYILVVVLYISDYNQ